MLVVQLLQEDPRPEISLVYGSVLTLIKSWQQMMMSSAV